ncbi:MAG: phosphatidate cytidylyltransferase [Limnochordia bacterium]|jgi:phosphatidate cytidylyltransferase|nr:phosphatidate cytidylyltransferase [Limnochordia bacterium]MDI9464908.1 phosphatidate cytidylyltransferase [Bacillota bacterium]NLO95203.1 phosphatidate cytidylyltransferase [Bacillota bacterium]HAN94351.1 phosphatidate cytidylyltransferase [Bacillota bacterium]HOB39924.1 phosphatidate cytidylyltransferase [Limnochordia bacterium]
MLRQRVLTAVVGLPILLAALFWGGAAWRLLVALIVAMGLWEFAAMGGPGLYLDYLAAAGLSFLAVTYSGVDGTKLLLWLVLQLLYYLLRASFSGMHSFASARNLLGVFYVAVLYSFLVLVREHFGLSWALFGFLATWATDTGAYFGGLRYGRRKLCPQISPNKSVEGALFGLVGGAVAGIIFALATGRPILRLTAFALVLSCCGQLGDLVESAMKREKGVKDSGSILPGHGGILDRFDSLSFVFPVLYALLSLFA